MMIIQPLDRTLSLDNQSARQSFHLGAELRAMVRRGDSGQPMLELQSGELLTPQSKVPLQPGTQLHLRVIQNQPTVILQIIEQRAASAALDAALRTLLPNSGSRAPLFDSLAALLDATSTPRLPPQLLNLITALTTHTHSPEQLVDAQRLAKTLQHAGPLLESHLLHAPNNAPRQDLKAQLLRLAAQIRSTLLETAQQNESLDRALLNNLLDHSDRALARIEAQQLQAISGRNLDLLFELPLQIDGALEKLQIRIQDEPPAPEQESAQDQDPGFLIRLRFDFSATGPIGAMLRLNGERLDLHWWAEQAGTSAYVQQALPQLEARLRELGLEVNELSCRDGAVPTIDELPILQTRGLLHEKA